MRGVSLLFLATALVPSTASATAAATAPAEPRELPTAAMLDLAVAKMEGVATLEFTGLPAEIEPIAAVAVALAWRVEALPEPNVEPGSGWTAYPPLSLEPQQRIRIAVPPNAGPAALRTFVTALYGAAPTGGEVRGFRADGSEIKEGTTPIAVDAPGSVHPTAEPQARATYEGPNYFPASLAEPSVSCDFGPQPTLQPILSDFEQQWYSEHLAAAGEPSLHASALPAAASGTLRFTWLRSFHAPVVIRVETMAAGGRRLIAKQLSGAGGYDPGRIAKKIDRRMTPREEAGLDAALDGGRLFGEAPRLCDLGLDGAQWIFEARDGTGYRFTQRWTPDEGPEHRLGRLLMRLTGWDFGEIY